MLVQVQQLDSDGSSVIVRLVLGYFDCIAGAPTKSGTPRLCKSNAKMLRGRAKYIAAGNDHR